MRKTNRNNDRNKLTIPRASLVTKKINLIASLEPENTMYPILFPIMPSPPYPQPTTRSIAAVSVIPSSSISFTVSFDKISLCCKDCEERAIPNN